MFMLFKKVYMECIYILLIITLNI